MGEYSKSVKKGPSETQIAALGRKTIPGGFKDGKGWKH